MKAEGIVLATSLLMVGCMVREGSFFDSGMDVRKFPDGSWVFQDTPRMWRNWMESVDSEIPREIAYINGTTQGDPLHGKPQGGGTWNHYWVSRIHALKDGHAENPQKYIDYIIDRRRSAGLPELVGHP